jgi:hypothetical protein
MVDTALAGCRSRTFTTIPPHVPDYWCILALSTKEWCPLHAGLARVSCFSLFDCG